MLLLSIAFVEATGSLVEEGWPLRNVVSALIEAGTALSHCPFIRYLRYVKAMNRLTIIVAYYYPDEVGIG